jgi:periplasmic protein TonB
MKTRWLPAAAVCLVHAALAWWMLRTTMAPNVEGTSTAPPALLWVRLHPAAPVAMAVAPAPAMAAKPYTSLEAQVHVKPLLVAPAQAPSQPASLTPAIASIAPIAPTAPIASYSARPVEALAPGTPSPEVAAPALTTASPPPPVHMASTLARADHQRCAPASHPAALRERGIEGAVTLRVKVNTQGRVSDVQVLASSGWRLFDEAAVHQTRGCHFHPARQDGQAVDSWVEFAVRFALADG